MCSLLTFELLHGFSYGISKMIKKRLVIYISSGAPAAGREPSPLRACDLFLMAIRRKCRARIINTDFSNGDISADSNGRYSNNWFIFTFIGEHFD